MKYILILTVLLTSGAFGNKFEDTLVKAKAGDADAQYELAEMYYLGSGIPENATQFVIWLSKSAEQGNANAQTVLGSMYLRGKKGLSVNYAEAIKWFRKSAEQGNASGQFHLGSQYYKSYLKSYLTKKIDEDGVKAYVWFSMAKTQGHPNGKRFTDEVKEMMNSSQIAQGEELAARCWESKFKDCP